MRLLAIKSYSTLGDHTKVTHVLESVKYLIKALGISWDEIAVYEVYDGFLTVTLAAIKDLEKQYNLDLSEKINPLDNAILRGDPVSAVGILMLTNITTF